MNALDQLLNSIGDFYCNISGEIISFQGILTKTGATIALQGKMSPADYQKINYYASYRIWGHVADTALTFLNSYFNGSQYTHGATDVSLTIEPSEIVIGRNYPEAAKVVQISMSTTSLNWMFPAAPLKPVFTFSIEQPSVLEYTFPGEIETSDKNGHLRVYQTFGYTRNHDEIRFPVKTIIEYSFNSPIEIMEATSKIATARNLFTFFANHYLPLENIKFSDETSPKTDGILFDDCTLYLNHNEDIQEINEPFLIMAPAFSSRFGDLWNRWLHLYEEAKHIPSLFYEIICNRSTHINRFLNMTQALEIYSTKYRTEYVKDIAAIRENTRSSKKASVHLNHRIEDIFMLINPCLNLEIGQIPKISKSIADMRNFFTHYNSSKYMEPSHQEVFAACLVLEFVLLAIIYLDLGLTYDQIADCKSRVQFRRFDEFVSMLNKNFLAPPPTSL